MTDQVYVTMITPH